MRKLKYVFILLGILGLITSCKTYSKEEIAGFDQQIQDYIKKDTLQYEKSESGLYYHIFDEGKGDHYIKFTDKVTFSYEGRLLNGEEFDKSPASNPATFYVKQLIMGWKEAFAYMKEGGKAKIIVPPQLGYGDKQLDRIPKNSVLIFNLEVQKVE